MSPVQQVVDHGPLRSLPVRPSPPLLLVVHQAGHEGGERRRRLEQQDEPGERRSVQRTTVAPEGQDTVVGRAGLTEGRGGASAQYEALCLVGRGLGWRSSRRLGVVGV